MVQKIVSEIR